MTNLDKYYLVTSGTNWNLKKQGDNTIILTDSNKEKAVAASAAYLRTRGGSLRIQKMDGTFEEERTYPRSVDPKSPG